MRAAVSADRSINNLSLNPLTRDNQCLGDLAGEWKPVGRSSRNRVALKLHVDGCQRAKLSQVFAALTGTSLHIRVTMTQPYQTDLSKPLFGAEFDPGAILSSPCNQKGFEGASRHRNSLPPA